MTETTTPDVRILTIRQPWATAITTHGKNVENRNWTTTWRGVMLVHAGGARPSFADRLRVEEIADVELDRQEVLPLSRIIGAVDLVDVHPAGSCAMPEPRLDDREHVEHCSPWAESTGYHWVLENPRGLRHPIVHKGGLGLLRFPAWAELGILS